MAKEKNPYRVGPLRVDSSLGTLENRGAYVNESSCPKSIAYGYKVKNHFLSALTLDVPSSLSRNEQEKTQLIYSSIT